MSPALARLAPRDTHLRRERQTRASFPAVRAAFAALYLHAFPREERRRLGLAGALPGDDGLLPGPSLEERLGDERFCLEGFFDGPTLVGLMAHLDLGSFCFGDYIASDATRADRVGVGQWMMRLWADETAARGQDAVAEVEPLLPTTAAAESAGVSALEPAHWAAAARTRRRRLGLFRRQGFRVIDCARYELPGGVPMALLIRLAPARPVVVTEAGPAPVFAPGELEQITQKIRATYA